MKLTLAITVFNRFELLKESYAQVIDDPRIDEVLIMDDHSEEEYWKDIQTLQATHPKIRVVRQVKNRGMSLNKYDAISLSKNNSVIIFDSDNVLPVSYLDAIPEQLDPNTFYIPSWAKPTFDYRAFEGHTITKDNVKKYLSKPMFEQCLNTCNMLVNRNKYTEVYRHDSTVKETDSLWMNFLWLQNGGSLYIVPNMHYSHLIHKNSGWLQNADYNIKKGNETKKLITEL